jgi:RND family efflux transporter MFP subunit
MNKVIRVISLVILIAGLLFVGYKLFLQPEKKEEADIIKAQDETEDDAQPRKEAPLPVKVFEVMRGDLPLRLRISATADVWEKTNMKSEVQGKIQDIRCRIGSKVSKGQLLIKIDDSEKKLDVESREANKLENLSKFLVKEKTDNPFEKELTNEQQASLKSLQEKYKKALRDFDRGRISESQFDKISEEYEEAMVFSGLRREEVLRATEKLTDAVIALKKAELDLKRTSIRSPFPGIISDLKVSRGEIVSPGQDLLRVINLDTVYLKGFALESEVGNLRPGIQTRIKFDSFPDSYFFGTIRSISPEVDSEKKTITVYVEVKNEENRIFPGMHAELDIEYQVNKNVIKVPRTAVIVRQDRPLVFVVEDNTAIWKYVELGDHNDEEVEIKSGIQEGDQVVIEGQLTLAHQSKVRIVK